MVGVRRAKPFVFSVLAVVLVSITMPPAPRLPNVMLAGCCSSWEPSFSEAVLVAKDEASEDFSCKSGDVAASFVASSHSKQATVRAQGCNRTAMYDCTVSCGDWDCRQLAR